MKKPKIKGVNTDQFMKMLWSKMVGDFRTVHGDDFLRNEEVLLLTDVAKFRDISWNRPLLSPVSYFKAKYQMECLLKRYCFESDKYTPDELQVLTDEKFLATQERIATPRALSHRARIVIQRARSIIAGVLGKYDRQEHINACRFGRRASFENPYLRSYLDMKVGDPTTGSAEHISWFKQHVLESDVLLTEAFESCVPMANPRDMICDYLTLMNVPKSFKSLRGIMPNTLIGSFYSYGLGKVIQKRLVGVNLNIRYLQKRHRRLVKLFSKSRTHATADLSAASDSFTSWLVNMLVPREWYNVLKYGRIGKFRFANLTTVSGLYHLESFMTMGIGFTFQLQTLLFYGLIKAIAELSDTKGLISVYGDDLIYPSNLHNYVKQVFADIGFILNEDKTFVKESFRESCGADSYCGFDVRPFQPEGLHANLPDPQYLLLLYKTINGLLRRWDVWEIPNTCQWLMSEILRTSPNSSLYQIPPDFPDYAGMKVEYPMKSIRINGVDFPFTQPSYGTLRKAGFNGTKIQNSALWKFKCLGLSRNKRAVQWQIPYYWEKLRQSSDSSDPFNPFEDEEDIPMITWVKRVVKKPWRGPTSRRRFKYFLVATVVRKGGLGLPVHQTGSTLQWN